MADFTVVQKHLTNYQSLREKMSPELREAFFNACVACDLSEDDSIHAIMAFQGELFSAAIDIQMKAVMTALTEALSARQAENKQLSTLLSTCQGTLKSSVAEVTKQAATSATQIETLQKEMWQLHEAERKARSSETLQFQQKFSDLKSALPDVQRAAETVANVNNTSVCVLLVLVALLTVVGTLVVEHGIFHL